MMRHLDFVCLLILTIQSTFKAQRLYKSSIDEVCTVNILCEDELICFDERCVCEQDKIWDANEGKCVNENNYRKSSSNSTMRAAAYRLNDFLKTFTCLKVDVSDNSEKKEATEIFSKFTSLAVQYEEIGGKKDFFEELNWSLKKLIGKSKISVKMKDSLYIIHDIIKMTLTKDLDSVYALKEFYRDWPKSYFFLAIADLKKYLESVEDMNTRIAIVKLFAYIDSSSWCGSSKFFGEAMNVINDVIYRAGPKLAVKMANKFYNEMILAGHYSNLIVSNSYFHIFFARHYNVSLLIPNLSRMKNLDTFNAKYFTNYYRHNYYFSDSLPAETYPVHLLKSVPNHLGFGSALKIQAIDIAYNFYNSTIETPEIASSIIDQIEDFLNLCPNQRNLTINALLRTRVPANLKFPDRQAFFNSIIGIFTNEYLECGIKQTILGIVIYLDFEILSDRKSLKAFTDRLKELLKNNLLENDDSLLLNQLLNKMVGGCRCSSADTLYDLVNSLLPILKQKRRQVFDSILGLKCASSAKPIEYSILLSNYQSAPELNKLNLINSFVNSANQKCDSKPSDDSNSKLLEAFKDLVPLFGMDKLLKILPILDQPPVFKPLGIDKLKKFLNDLVKSLGDNLNRVDLDDLLNALSKLVQNLAGSSISDPNTVSKILDNVVPLTKLRDPVRVIKQVDDNSQALSKLGPNALNGLSDLVNALLNSGLSNPMSLLPDLAQAMAKLEKERPIPFGPKEYSEVANDLVGLAGKCN